MVECQWDSVVLSPYSPVLTGLALTFMGLTRSNSSLFSNPGFVVSSVEKEKGGRKQKGRREKGNRKGGKEGRREEGIKKDQRQDKKEF